MAFETPPPLPELLAGALPFERRAWRLEEGPDTGRLIHLLDHGPRDARPVLLVHSNPTWSFLWRKIIERLPELRCVAPDLLGLGFSDKLPHPADHQLERHVAAIAELVRALGLSRTLLVGQDWGGPVVALAGARDPERVAGIVFGNTAVVKPRRWRGTAFHRLSRLPLVSELVFRVFGFPQNALHRVQGDPTSIRGEVAEAYRWPLRRWRDRAAPLGLARMVPDGEDHPSVAPLLEGETWLRSFEGPMALVWGEKDPILGRALRRHAEAFPNALVTRTQAGHFLQEEVPDELAAAIRDVAARAG